MNSASALRANRVPSWPLATAAAQSRISLILAQRRCHNMSQIGGERPKFVESRFLAMSRINVYGHFND